MSIGRVVSKSKTSKVIKFLSIAAVVFCYAGLVFAETTPTGGGMDNIGGIAKNITGSFSDLGKLMVAVAYLAGFGFTVSAIFKFKQHKDNPTQIPMGTPIALLVVGIVLIFIPALIKVGGGTAGFTAEQAGGFTGSGVSTVPGGGDAKKS